MGAVTEATVGSEWGSEQLDVAGYLRRLGIEDGQPPPSAETLRRLHRAHVAAIPFENLDIVLGRPVTLDVPSLQDKLVHRRRGGYCFEHNTLFSVLLERLGFAVDRLNGRIRWGSNHPRPRSHTLLRVHADGRDWLADVGFGGEGLLEPVPLHDGATSHQGEWTYRLDRSDDGTWALRSLHPDGWFDLYAFTTEPQHRADYVVYNYFTSTNPASPFVAGLHAQRTEPTVRHVLRNRELLAARPDGTAERRDVPDGELVEVLSDTFGIVLEPADAARLPGLLDRSAAPRTS
jgi:N-hydroxyarylamine O-acetyltransferase